MFDNNINAGYCVNHTYSEEFSCLQLHSLFVNIWN